MALLTLRLRIPTLPYAPPAARFIAAQLAEVGVTAEVEELEWARWLELVYGDGDYGMTIVAHVEPRDIVDFANPDSYWLFLLPNIIITTPDITGISTNATGLSLDLTAVARTP